MQWHQRGSLGKESAAARVDFPDIEIAAAPRRADGPTHAAGA